MSFKKTTANNLAAAFLDGAWSPQALIRRGREATGSKGRWLGELARRVFTTFGEGRSRLQQEVLARFILNDPSFGRAYQRCKLFKSSRRRVFFFTPVMAPAPGPPATWSIPALASTAQLAQWLGCSPNRLDWYCGRYRRPANDQDSDFARYNFQWLRKRSGRRLLEQPIAPLKQIQRRLLHDLLHQIPPHEAVHSYCPGHSLAGYVQPHAGKRLVICLDLCDFFPSIQAARVHALFETLGYPRAVARALTGLCTSAAPPDILDQEAVRDLPPTERWRLWQVYRTPHLPQGAPTSPMLSNLCAFRLDVRLAALARSMDACYTRYADDLAFSGDAELERSRKRFHLAVCRIALEEGFEINTRKTRTMRRGTRQQLAGLVVNTHPNIARRKYDRLKAILHNCLKHGPESQNRTKREHFQESLTGRVQWVRQIHPDRGRKLQALLEQISWLPGEPA